MLVNYKGNNSAYDQTGAISFSDGRPDLVLGGDPGEMTEEEFVRLSVIYNLEEVGQDLSDLTKGDLQRMAAERGLETSGTKDQIAARIEDHDSSATATVEAGEGEG